VARSSSIISVSIIGDAKKLIGAVNAADQSTGGLIKSTVKVVGASVAIRKGFDLINDSLAEADRRGDAIQRLTNQIGNLADPLIKTADNFSKIGASAQDMIELEATFADLATSAGVTEPEIAANAEQLSAMALALAQVHDADPSAIMDAIGKAIGGQTRGIKQYGVDLTEASVAQRAMEMTGKDNAKALTAQELAAARTSLIMEAFTPILDQVATGTGDVAQKQDELGAKFETVSGKIGVAVEGPLGSALDWINDMIDAIPAAMDGWGALGDKINDVVGQIQGPLNDLRALVANLLDMFSDLRTQTSGNFDRHDSPNGQRDRDIAASLARERERNGLGR
jgi:hypothetical protein